MKRLIILFAAVLLASIGWSQTMTINLKDGTTIKIDMKTVKTIEFTDDESGNNPDDSSPSWLLGTWMVDYNTGYGYEEDRDDEYMRFKSDGTFVNVIDDEDGVYIQHGTWKLTDNAIILRIIDGDLAGSSFTYTVLEKTSDKLTISLLGITVYLIRSSDSAIDKYL